MPAISLSVETDFMDLQRRIATTKDQECARTLHHEAYQDLVLLQFGEWNLDQQDRFFNKKWNPENFEMIMVDGSLCGYLSVFEYPDHFFLSEIVLLPSFQGRGIGTKLLIDQMQKAKRDSLPLRLQVLKANRAIELYTRLGFVECGRTDTHVQMLWDFKQ
jgi:ribosomal protein S18 acetylase RimI-like enzyme